MMRYQELTRREKPGKVLDIGCADGSLVSQFIGQGWCAFGIDINYVNVLSTNDKGVFGVVGLLEEPLPYLTDSFDLVLAKEVIEHIIDTRFFVEETFRILRPGGLFVLSTPNLASLSNRLRLLFGKYPGWMDYELGNGAGHVRYYTLPILRNQLTSTGFQIEVETGTELALPLLSRIFPENKSRIMRGMGEKMPSIAHILVLGARKPA